MKQPSDITHHSPSSLHTFMASPAKYLVQKLAGIYTPAGMAAQRGLAVEAGVTESLRGNDGRKETEEEFRSLMAERNLEVTDKDLADALAMHDQAMEVMAPYVGEQFDTQSAHEYKSEDLKHPIIGYSDFYFPKLGIIFDLKTTMRMPSTIRPTHARQLAFYLHNTNHAGKIIYATPKKAALYTLENAADHVKILVEVAKRLEKFLSLGTTEDLLGAVVPDLDHYHWSSEEDSAIAWDLFKI